MLSCCTFLIFFFFFFNDTATTEIYTLSLHDALPICHVTVVVDPLGPHVGLQQSQRLLGCGDARDRKSTRLNSSHLVISYAVFCLKKKKKHNDTHIHTSITIHVLSLVSSRYPLFAHPP